MRGNGNGGGDETTGWIYASVRVEGLNAGTHTLTLGGYNNRKSWTNETTEVLLDDVRVSIP